MRTLSRSYPILAAVVLVGACSAFPESLLDSLGTGDGGTTGNEVDASADALRADGAPDASAPTSRYFAAVMANEPVLYLRLGESTGTVAHDERGKFDGTYSTTGLAYGTPGPLAGDPDTAMTFSNGSGRITIPAGIEFDQFKPFTAEVWFRVAPENTEIGFIFDHERHGPRQGWTLRVGGGGPSFERWNEPTSTIGDGTGVALTAPEAWHHLVGVFDGTKQFIFVDAKLVAQQTVAQALPVLGTTFSIGQQNCDCGSDSAFIGALDEVAIYDKALTEQDVHKHYDAAR